MKKIILKCLVLAVVLMVINQCLYQLFPSVYFGQPDADHNWNYLLEHATDYNLIFMGSSRIVRHIDPEEFNAACDPAPKIRSYNMGLGGMQPPESYYLLEKILQMKPAPFRYILVELELFQTSGSWENIGTLRAEHWYTFDWYFRAVRLVLGSGYGSARKVKTLTWYTHQWFRHSLNSGYTAQQLRPPGSITFASWQHGYEARNAEKLAAWLSSPPPNAREDLIAYNRYMLETHERFLENPERLEALKRKSMAAFSQPNRTPGKSAHHSLIRNLIQRAKTQNVDLIFLLTPRSYFYDQLLPLYDALPAEHKIELADANRYPQFYAREYSFNVGHLNEAGAQLFTKALARRFSELITPDQPADQ